MLIGGVISGVGRGSGRHGERADLRVGRQTAAWMSGSSAPSSCAPPTASVLVAVLLLTACGSSTGSPSSAPTTGAAPSSGTPASMPPTAAGASPAPAEAPAADVTAELLAAAYANDVQRAETLVRAGGDVNTEDASQQSAFLIATSEVGDDPRLLELTLAAGADIAAQDSYDGTGLIRAAERGHPQIVARLLAAGVAVDHVNRLGWTALLEAVILGDGGPEHTETVRLLVDAGADVELPDAGGVTALAHAQRRGQRDIVGLLQAAGARC